jgi:hypothetical protein
MVPEDPNCQDWEYVRFSKRVRLDWYPQQEEHEGEASVFELRFLVSSPSLKHEK